MKRTTIIVTLLVLCAISSINTAMLCSILRMERDILDKQASNRQIIIHSETPKTEAPPVIQEPPIEVTKGLTPEELDLICKVVQAEAGNQSELGKRLVVDVIFNRVDSGLFPNTITEVINQPKQFSTVVNGVPVVSTYPEELKAIVEEEFANRTDYRVAFFRTGQYHGVGVPLFQEGAHYFSGLKE